jgi:hypothetical protein
MNNRKLVYAVPRLHGLSHNKSTLKCESGSNASDTVLPAHACNANGLSAAVSCTVGTGDGSGNQNCMNGGSDKHAGCIVGGADGGATCSAGGIVTCGAGGSP